MLIREERLEDLDAIRAVNEAAFGGADEAHLVKALRQQGYVVTSLVAVDHDDSVVGHILFSRLPIEGEHGTHDGAALAPMAVHPARQRQGIGQALVKAGLQRCRAKGVEAVVVLGHPDYYPRFGFSTEAARLLEAPYQGEAFMALNLRDAAASVVGVARYPAPFEGL